MLRSLCREMTLHKINYFYSDHISVGKNIDMFTSINGQKLNVWYTSLEHFSVHLKSNHNWTVANFNIFHNSERCFHCFWYEFTRQLRVSEIEYHKALLPLFQILSY